jgi:PPE-repeat protein
MWAQDAAAMYGYAGASASATTLTPFTPAPQTTDPRGSVGQAATVAQAGGTAAGNAQSTVSSAQPALSAVPNTLSSLAAAGDPPSLTPLNTLSNLLSVFLDAPANALSVGVDTPFSIFSYPPDVASYLVGLHTDDAVSAGAGIAPWPEVGAVGPTPSPLTTNLVSPMSAGLGEANTVGTLSVPPGWAAAAPEIRPLAVALPAASFGAAAETSAGGAGSLFSQMALAGMAGRAMAGTAGSGGLGRRERIGERIRATADEPTEPPQSPAGGPITGIAAELRELAALRDSGILTHEEFSEQKRLLLPTESFARVG